MNVLQHTRNEPNLRLKQNRPDRSYRDTLLKIIFVLNYLTVLVYTKKIFHLSVGG